MQQEHSLLTFYQKREKGLLDLELSSCRRRKEWRGVMVSGVRRMNEVNVRRARFVPWWVTVFGRVYHLGM